MSLVVAHGPSVLTIVASALGLECKHTCFRFWDKAFQESTSIDGYERYIGSFTCGFPGHRNLVLANDEHKMIDILTLSNEVDMMIFYRTCVDARLRGGCSRALP